MLNVARTAAKVCIPTLSLLLTGCALAPVPLPPPASTAPVASATATSQPVATETPSGFTAYEKAALRLRNVGCGGVIVGSGFGISDHVLVTNRHVIGGAAQLEVSTYDGQDISVQTTGAAVIADLALVWTVQSLPATIELAASNPDIGTNVTAVGFPSGGPLTTTHGKVLGYGAAPVGWSTLPMLINDAPITHGSSGSPLIDDNGQLVGVAYASAGSQYAIPVNVLRQVLNDPNSYANQASCDGAP